MKPIHEFNDFLKKTNWKSSIIHEKKRFEKIVRLTLFQNLSLVHLPKAKAHIFLQLSCFLWIQAFLKVIFWSKINLGNLYAIQMKKQNLTIFKLDYYEFRPLLNQ